MKRSSPFQSLLLPEILSRLFSFLWFPDLLNCMQLDKHFNNILNDAYGGAGRVIACNMLTKLLSLIHNANIDIYSFIMNVSNIKVKDIMRMATRSVFWPNDIDMVSIILTNDHSSLQYTKNYGIKEVEMVGSHSRCVAYQGKKLGSDRSFVANHPFPWIFVENSSFITNLKFDTSSVPFTKVIAIKKDADNSIITIPVLSVVSYFEITIHPIPTTTKISNISNLNQIIPCVCIGVSTCNFEYECDLPGWCHNSWGYHGDDGSFQHGGLNITNKISFPQFGVGDSVGFGMMYFDDGIYFFVTKNGNFVGRVFSNIITREPLFPTVGTDCYNAIEMNFGNTGKLFVFDIAKYEYDLEIELANSELMNLERKLFGYAVNINNIQEMQQDNRKLSSNNFINKINNSKNNNNSNSNNYNSAYFSSSFFASSLLTDINSHQHSTNISIPEQFYDYYKQHAYNMVYQFGVPNFEYSSLVEGLTFKSSLINYFRNFLHTTLV
eukprot:gene16658-22772_t